jgi:hypothetical protein
MPVKIVYINTEGDQKIKTVALNQSIKLIDAVDYKKLFKVTTENTATIIQLPNTLEDGFNFFITNHSNFPIHFEGIDTRIRHKDNGLSLSNKYEEVHCIYSRLTNEWIIIGDLDKTIPTYNTFDARVGIHQYDEFFFFSYINSILTFKKFILSNIVSYNLPIITNNFLYGTIIKNLHKINSVDYINLNLKNYVILINKVENKNNNIIIFIDTIFYTTNNYYSNINNIKKIDKNKIINDIEYTLNIKDFNLIDCKKYDSSIY